MIYESFSPEETINIAFEFGSNALPGDIFCLNGDLGVGKTIFTKGFAKGLEIPDYNYITSPTFNIINEHEGRLKLHHFDVYRITDIDEMYDTGFEELFFGKDVCLIEWAETIKSLIPNEAFWITIEKNLDKGEDYRKITVRGVKNENTCN